MPHVPKSLTINLSKTEILIWNWNQRSDGAYTKFIIKIQDVILINTKHFKYLSVWIKFSVGDKDTEHRIGCATRVIFLNKLIRSGLSYGFQWKCGWYNR